MSLSWQVGGTIHGRWEIHRVLTGGMGVVYIVYDRALGEAFAAKTFRDELFNRSAKVANQFTQEALIWITLERHQNIAEARFIEVIEGKPYVFVEFVSGGDLTNWIGTPKMRAEQVLRFGAQFCDGMAHAVSKGLRAHRDIKPQNCLITEDGTLKITDFGLAKVLTDVEVQPDLGRLPASSALDLPRTGGGLSESFRRFFSRPRATPPHSTTNRGGSESIVGTCTHMAPEQFSDGRSVDIRADVYSFGVMLFQMATGRLPFCGRDWSDYERLHKLEPPPDVYGQFAFLNNLIKCCLAKSPARRPADFSIIRSLLDDEFQHLVGQSLPSAQFGANLTARGYFNKGLSLSALSKNELALSAYEECLRKCSEYESLFEHALVNKGIVLTLLNRHDDADNCYDRALQLNPHDAKAWVNKGISLFEGREFHEAESCYRQALVIAPDFHIALCNLGIVLHGMGQVQEALMFHNRAAEVDANDHLNWMNRGICLKDLGRFEEAMDSYEAGLKLNPRSALLWYNKAVVHGELGQVEQELACYTRALHLDPTDAAAWFNKGIVLRQIGNFDDALSCYDKALSINPCFVDALQNKGIALAMAGRQIEAIESFGQVIALAPTASAAWFCKGHALRDLGHIQDALECYKQAAALGHPEAGEAVRRCRQELSEVPLRSEQPETSEELATELFNQAQEFITEGNRDAAVKAYVKAMDLTGERTAEERIFKAFVAYQCGLCLLKQLTMEAIDPSWFTASQKQAATQIRSLWTTTLRLHATLTKQDLRSEFGMMLPAIIRNIQRDVLMR